MPMLWSNLSVSDVLFVNIKFLPSLFEVLEVGHDIHPTFSGIDQPHQLQESLSDR